MNNWDMRLLLAQNPYFDCDVSMSDDAISIYRMFPVKSICNRQTD